MAEVSEKSGRRLLRRVARTKDVNGDVRPESGQFEVSTPRDDLPDANWKMSVDAEWIILEADEDVEAVCLGERPELGLVSVPLEILKEFSDIAFEVDGVPRPSHAGVFHVDEDGQQVERRLRRPVRKRLAETSEWVRLPGTAS